jgi:EpsI family protein
MIARAVVLSAVILAGGAVARVAQTPERPIVRSPLADLPCTVDRWSCDGNTPLDRKTLAVLRVDDYLNRTYKALPASDAGIGSLPADPSVGLYIAYYGSQRQGESIHSPQNCLPGSGWQPVSSERSTLDVGGTALPINRYVVQKGLDRQVVLYWYQGRGRVVANEYLNKFWLMIDQAHLGRSNAALVRIVAPATGSDDKALQMASASADRFARAIYPRLSPHLP